MTAMLAFLDKCALRVVEGCKMEFRVLVLMALAVLCMMDITQLVFALVGAVTYALIQASTCYARKPPPGGLPGKGKPKAFSSAQFVPSARPIGSGPAPAPRTPCASPTLRRTPVALPKASLEEQRLATPKSDLRQPSSQPVLPPTFAAVGWDAEVDELVGKIAPSAKADRIVQQLAQFVKASLMPLIPEVEVMGFASGDLSRGTAFGVAVPEVDIVMCVSPHALAARLRGRTPLPPGPQQRAAAPPAQPDVQKLHKSAIRACTDRLVASGQFKFRRSAFRGHEPKVTLLAPTSLGIHHEAIPIDFSVNSTTPLYNAALITECGQMEPRAKALTLLVKRWAKDRGICHAAKGHLSPYAWTLMAIYFLQVGLEEGGPLLPPLEEFELSSRLTGQADDGAEPARRRPPAAGKPKWVPQEVPEAQRKSVGALFKEFVRFYAQTFNYRREAVCVRMGKRAPPTIVLPLHVVLHDDGVTTSLAPSVEDPFDTRRNLGACMTAASCGRMMEELLRADQLCSGGGSLAKLLEPWAPSDGAAEGEDPGDGAEN